MEHLTDSNVEHWQNMATKAIEKFNETNHNRDDWQLTNEIKTLEKFQRHLARRNISVRLFEAAQRHIQFATSGRIRDEHYHHQLARRAAKPDDGKIIL